MTDPVQDDIRALREEIARFNDHRFVRVQNSLWRMLFQALLRGMAVGLGTVIGASILVSVLLYMLSQINFLPIIGDWATEIASEIRASTGIQELGQTLEGQGTPDTGTAPQDPGTD